MFLFTPQRYPQGMTDQPYPGNTCLWGDYPTRCPVTISEYHSDFYTYAAGDWTVTTAGSGTTAIAGGNGGNIIQTTGTVSGQTQANQLVGTPLNFIIATPPQRKWFWINFNLSDATNPVFLAGWVNSLAAMAPTSGVYFSKVTTSTTLNFIINNGGATTTVPVGTLVAATTYTVGWYYDSHALQNVPGGVPGTPGTIYIFSTIGLTLPYTRQGTWQVFGGTPVASIGANSNAFPSLANLPAPATALTMGFGLQTQAASAKTNTVDYVGTASYISRF